MLKVLITGANGQLGQSIQKFAHQYAKLAFTFVTRQELDLSHPQIIESYFDTNQFDVIINCAAYTAVDKAEEEPNLADQINHQAVAQLAKICQKKHTPIIHISTDYVFDGKNFRPYKETDPTHPQNTYGRTKLRGEQALLKANINGLIIRTSWVYSEFGHNFVKTMLKLSKTHSQLNIVSDQIGTPTYAGDLAQTILNILANHQNKLHAPIQHHIYHYSNLGVASWYDFAHTIFQLKKISCQIHPIPSESYPTPAKRPYYSLLNKSKIQQAFQLDIPHWQQSLAQCLTHFS